MSTTDRKLRIFLCHSSQDKPTVREIRQRLAEESWIDPWLDEEKLLPGEDWRTSIEKAVESADLVVICLSNNSVNKEGFVQKELRYAREISLEKPEGAIFLIPLRLDECDVPRGLRFLQWANYFGDDKEENYRALLESFNFRYTQVVRREENQSLQNVREKRPYRDVLPIATALSDYYDRIDELSKRQEDTFGVPTGFVDLDKLLLGIQPGELLIVASYLGQGKTSFLVSIIKNIALRFKKRVAFFSVGIPNDQLVHRLVIQETGIDSNRLRIGKLEEEEWPLFTHAIEVFADTHIYVDDSPFITPQELQFKCRGLHTEWEVGLIDLIVVDNSHLILNNEDNAPARTKDASLAILKKIARELNVPVLASVQLPRVARQYASKRPALSDLHEFDLLEENADVIIFIHNPDLQEAITNKSGIAEIILAKKKQWPYWRHRVSVSAGAGQIRECSSAQ